MNYMQVNTCMSSPVIRLPAECPRVRICRCPLRCGSALTPGGTVWLTRPRLHREACDCGSASRPRGIAFYDSLIAASAQTSGCGVLFGEDVNTREKMVRIRIANPYAGLSS